MKLQSFLIVSFFIFLLIFIAKPALLFAATCSYSSDHPYQLLVDYLDGKVNDIVCQQKVYSDDGLCTGRISEKIFLIFFIGI